MPNPTATEVIAQQEQQLLAAWEQLLEALPSAGLSPEIRQTLQRLQSQINLLVE